MSLAALDKLIREAHAAGFRQVIITGGEPLTHPQRDEMLAMLAEWRQRVGVPPSGGICQDEDRSNADRLKSVHQLPHQKMNLVLRTNFAMPLNDDDLRRIAAAFDQVVVSVDGTEQTHDARRGQGTYSATVRNLEAYVKLHGHNGGNSREEAQNAQKEDSGFASSCAFLRPTNPFPSELSLACVMRAADIQGEAGDAVRQLAHRLGIHRTRFRPLLPLGRAADWNEPPQSEALGAHADPLELIENGFHPVASCGLGQNLYVEPSGESFPCYAYHQPHSLLGNVIENRLSSILQTERFQDLSRHTVDTNPKCRACDLCYLCGGACRAWGGAACQHNLDATPSECDGLRARAAKLLAAATDYLDHQPSPKGQGT
jgi:uncharacterized protein